MKKVKASDVVLPAMGAVLIAVCSLITIPTTIPYTLQTFAVFCVLCLFGGKNGLLSIIVYIALGAAGLPIFSGFSSGISVLFGATGGYIAGFVFTGIIYLLFTKLLSDALWVKIIALIIGLFVLYAFGTAWFMTVYANRTGPIGLSAALMTCVVPFIIPDLIKLAAAVLVSVKIAPVLKKRFKN